MGESQGEIGLGLVVVLPEVEADRPVCAGFVGELHAGVRFASHRIEPGRPEDRPAHAKVPDRLQVGKKRQPKPAFAPVGVQGHRVVQQNPLRVAGENREHAHAEQIVANLFQDCRVAALADDRLVDLRSPFPLDQLSFDQLAGRHVHRETAHRRPAGQVEHERAFFLLAVRVVERLVDLDQGHRRLENDVHVIPGNVQPNRGFGLRVAHQQLPKPLRLRDGRSPGLDPLPLLATQRLGLELRAGGTPRRFLSGGNLPRLPGGCADRDAGRALRDGKLHQPGSGNSHLGRRALLEPAGEIAGMERPGRLLLPGGREKHAPVFDGRSTCLRVEVKPRILRDVQGCFAQMDQRRSLAEGGRSQPAALGERVFGKRPQNGPRRRLVGLHGHHPQRLAEPCRGIVFRAAWAAEHDPQNGRSQKRASEAIHPLSPCSSGGMRTVIRSSTDPVLADRPSSRRDATVL